MRPRPFFPVHERSAVLTVAALLALAAGCDDDSTPPSVADMSVAVAGDMAIGRACTLAAHDCPSYAKCGPAWPGLLQTTQGPNPAFACLPLRGTLTEGTLCDPQADACGDGLTCVPYLQEPRCLRVCQNDSGCATGESCALDAICMRPCTPFGADCPAGQSCGTFLSLHFSSSFGVGPFCRETSTAPLPTYAACQRESDCADNQACWYGSDCAPFCDASHPCPTPAVDGGAAIGCQAWGSTTICR